MKERFKNGFVLTLLDEGLKMREQWVGKNVDLALLSERVEDFFKGKVFQTRKDVLADGYKISATPGSQERLRGVVVYVRGKSSDFVVEFFAGKRERSPAMLGFLVTLFGGGGLVLRSLKLQEAMEKLEREFWAYTEEAIAELTDSVEQHL